MPFFFDQVIFKRNNRRRIYARMAVELPGLPHSLKVSPAVYVGFCGLLRNVPAANPVRPRPRNLLACYSKRPADQARQQAFLTADHLHALESIQSENGKVYPANGRLFLITNRHGGMEIDLEALYTGLDQFVANEKLGLS